MFSIIDNFYNEKGVTSLQSDQSLATDAAFCQSAQKMESKRYDLYSESSPIQSSKWKIQSVLSVKRKKEQS